MGRPEENNIEKYMAMLQNKHCVTDRNENIDDGGELKFVKKIIELKNKVILVSKLSSPDKQWKRIENRMKKNFRSTIILNFRRYAAVFILIIVLSGVGVILVNKAVTNNKDVFTQIVSYTGQKKKIKMPDGTEIILGANSYVKYNKNYGKENRNVIFKGEAVFDVEKNCKIPFVLKTEKAQIIVVGTKFLATCFPVGNKNEVVLLKGKIKYKKGKNIVEISEGERIIHNFKPETIKTQQIDINKYEQWEYGKVYLDNDYLEYLAVLMEQWYGVKFIFENEELKKINFSGMIDKRRTLEYNLNIISLTNKVIFKKYENRIIVTTND